MALCLFHFFLLKLNYLITCGFKIKKNIIQRYFGIFIMIFFVNRKLTRTVLYFNILKQTLWCLPLTRQWVGNTCRVICSSNTSLRNDFWKPLAPLALKDNTCVKHTSDLVLAAISFLFLLPLPQISRQHFQIFKPTPSKIFP